MDRRLVAIALLAACGRVSFDARDDAGGGDTDRSPAIELDLKSGNTANLSFMRGSPASYVGADRLIHIAADNEPRFEHDPITGAPRGLLIENEISNLVVYSEQLNFGIEWFSNGSGAINANVAVAPDGSLSADEVIDTDTTGAARRAQSANIPATRLSYTFSIFLKAETQTRASFGAELLGGVPDQTAMDIDFTTGTISSPPLGAEGYGIVPFANGWYRVWITLANQADNNSAIISVWSYLPNVADTGSVYAWGAQIETGPIMTSYVETPTNVAVMRAGDIAQVADLSGVTPERGSLLVTASLTRSFETLPPEYQPLVCMTSPIPNTVCVSRAMFDDRTTLSYDNVTTVATGGDWAGTARRTIIAAWDDTSITLHEPGTSATLGLAAPLPTFDRVYLGFNQDVALDGCIERLAYWPFALTDDELAAAGVQ